MGRGQKLCPNGHINGPRSFKCGQCYHVFTIKTKINKVRKTRKRKQWERCQWGQLRYGDIIKIKTNSGPYWINELGEMISMGYHGTFKVETLENNGIRARSYNNKSHSGSCFIYMGEEIHSETTNIYRRPHEIRKFIPKEVDKVIGT